jgi:eukaryotic-like serine/threonine-protein kinase
VAIKRVLPHLTEKRQFINMFLDEARLSARLSHSNCVQVFDIGKGDNAYFIVMEFVDGADLKAITEHLRAKGQSLPVEEACLITVRICEGLAYAHELRDEANQPLNIVHRDMSPPNILITNYGEVKIADFGLAKANSQLEQSQPGVIKGKFGYLSPEAAHGQSADFRTDIFAVGVMLWEMLTSKRLFQGATDLETVRMVQRAEVPDIRAANPSVPASVANLLARALAKTPEARYQSARDFGSDLNQALFDMPRAVSSFDVARIVTTVKAEMAAAKHRTQNRITLIGSMIEDALIEFTSLDAQGGQSPTRQNSVSFTSNSLVGPLPSAAENVDWGNSLGLGSSPHAGAAPGGARTVPQGDPSDELGNLAMLEDERNHSNPARGEKKSVAAMVAAAAAVLVLGLGAAYFTGLIPH